MSDRPAIRVRSRRAGLVRWGGLVPPAAAAVTLAVAGCTGPTGPPAPVAAPTTAAAVCSVEQAELLLDPVSREDVLTRVEVFDIEAGGTSESIVVRDDEDRRLTVVGLPENADWTSWLLRQATARYPEIPLDEGYHLSSQMNSEFPYGSEDVGRYVSFRSLREARVPFRIACATARHEGTIRTWDRVLSGIVQCGEPQDKSEVIARVATYCDRF